MSLTEFAINYTVITITNYYSILISIVSYLIIKHCQIFLQLFDT